MGGLLCRVAVEEQRVVSVARAEGRLSHRGVEKARRLPRSQGTVGVDFRCPESTSGIDAEDELAHSDADRSASRT